MIEHSKIKFSSGGKTYFIDHNGDSLVQENNELIDISRQQRKLLLFLVKNSGRVVNRDEISDKVWGHNISNTTIDTAIKSIRKSLNDDAKNPRFIQTVTGTGYRFLPEAQEIRIGNSALQKVEVAQTQASLDAHRAELIIFTPHINEFLSVLGEYRDIAEMVANDPSSISAAAMLQGRIDDFKGFNVNSTDDLFVQMQRYFGYYMNVVLLLFDGLAMLANERVYGFNGEKSIRPDSGQLLFNNEAEFRNYLRDEVAIGADLLSSVIIFVKRSLQVRPDILLLQAENKENVEVMTQWSRKIARDARGDELLFERI